MLDINALDRIIKETLEAIERSKIQIYDIAENSRAEMIKVANEVAAVKDEVAGIIKQVDELALKEKKARIRLMEVSKCPSAYNLEYKLETNQGLYGLNSEIF